MPYKSFRRSLRVVKTDEKAFHHDVWMCFPLEMKFQVFNNLEASDLTKFALTSKIVGNDILMYIQSTSGLKRIKQDLLKRSSEHEHFMHEYSRTLGFLLRSVTFTMPRQLKVQVAFDIIMQLKWTLDAQKECDDSYFTCFGIFLRTFQACWSLFDLSHTYPYIQRVIRVESMMRQVLNSAPGRLVFKERAIRLFYHHVYFLHNEKNMIRFWLGTILMSFPFVHQARLLYILFGPTKSGLFIDWMSQLSNSSIMLSSDLTKFASIVSLLEEHESFTDDDILTLIGEIIILPQQWHHFHIAHFLLSCGHSILVSYMSNVLANGRYNDLCIFVFRCAWVLMKQGKEVTNVLNSLGRALCSHNSNPADASTFLEQLPVFLHRVSHSEEIEVHGVSKDAVHRVVAELLRVLLKHKRHLSEVFQPRKNITCKKIVVLRE